MSNFRMLTTKNTLNSAFFDAHPTLTGGELTKSGVKPPVITQKNFMIRPKKCQIGAFFFLPKNSQFSGSKKALITDTEDR